MFNRGFHSRGYFGDMHMFNGYAGGIGSAIITIGVLILIGVFIYWLVKKSDLGNKKNTLLEELKMKYVNDEITEEEYLRKKEVLQRK